MNKYHYKAKNSKAKEVAGIVEAETEEEARQVIAEKELYPITIILEKDLPPSKRKKHIVLLVLGLLMTVIAEGFMAGNPNAYTAGALAVIFLSRPIIYFVTLGLFALAATAICKSVKQFWFPVLAWLFFAAGVCDIISIVLPLLILKYPGI